MLHILDVAMGQHKQHPKDMLLIVFLSHSLSIYCLTGLLPPLAVSENDPRSQKSMGSLNPTKLFEDRVSFTSHHLATCVLLRGGAA